MGYSSLLNPEAAETTAALRADAETTDGLLSIEDSVQDSIISLC
jgi:hypothetical protein